MGKVLKICKSIGACCINIWDTAFPSPPTLDPANVSFMTCLLKVDVTSSGWHKEIDAILKSNKGVRKFIMSGDGKILVTGTADLKMLLKMLEKAKKSITVIWVQSGLCSANMFSPNGLDYLQHDPRWPIRGGGGFGASNDVAFGPQPTFQIIRAPMRYDYYDYNDLPSHPAAAFYGYY